jgi:hypothetical protein
MISSKDFKISLDLSGNNKKDDVEEMNYNECARQFNEKDESTETKINHILSNNQGKTPENHMNSDSKDKQGNLNYIKQFI